MSLFVFTLNGRRTRVKRLRQPSIRQRGVSIWRWNPNGWIWRPVRRLSSVWICSYKLGNFASVYRPLICVRIVINECCLKPSKLPLSLKSTLSDVEIVAPSIRDVFALTTSRVDGARGRSLRRSSPTQAAGPWKWHFFDLFTEEVVGTRADLVRLSPMREQAWYRKKAAECDRRAALVSEEHLKKVYLELTRQWLEMAQQAEFFDRVRGPILLPT